jgi:hypothetical protein
MDYPKIVDADVRKLRAARNLADRPTPRRGRLQSLVNLDVTSLGQLDSG